MKHSNDFVYSILFLFSRFIMAISRRRFTRRYLKAKRNSERIIRSANSNILGNTQQVAFTYTAQEACTVKSIKLDVGVNQGTASNVSLPYVLVLVPEGYEQNGINYPALTDDLYNPTNLVLINGIITDAAVEDHKYNMIGRKMKKGDRLALIVKNSQANEAIVSFEMSFSVLT